MAWGVAISTNPLEAWSAARPVDAAHVSQLGADRDTGRMVVATGWPVVAIASQYESTSRYHGTPVDAVIGITINGEWTHELGPFPRSLPIEPLWFGLFIDSAIYGLLAWFRLTFPADDRRSLRKHRGRCLACGYKITEGTCPECGTVTS